MNFKEVKDAERINYMEAKKPGIYRYKQYVLPAFLASYFLLTKSSASLRFVM